jgi:four helix bundle protein
MSDFGKMIDEKCLMFAVRVVNLCRFLDKEGKGRFITDQLNRSGMSIGANFAEAECAISDNEFLAKLYISLKECNETLYWLRLLRRVNDLDEKQYKSIYDDGEEIKRLLVSIIKSKRNNMGKKTFPNS